MTVPNRLALASATAALATTGIAGAAGAPAPQLADAPFLGRVSGGAAVNYKLTRTPGRQVVTIAGHTARVHVVGTKSDREYTAIVNQAGFRAGRKYRVVIQAYSRDLAKVMTFNKLLYLHRSLNRPQGG